MAAKLSFEKSVKRSLFANPVTIIVDNIIVQHLHTVSIAIVSNYYMLLKIIVWVAIPCDSVAVNKHCN